MFCLTYNVGKHVILSATVCFIIFTGSGPVYGQDSSSFETGKLDGVEQATWRFEFDYEVFFNKDNKISTH